MTASTKRENPPTVMLVLQGGGALGAYQVGAYEAMVKHGIEPNWVSGISIGAINSAIIATNPANDRLKRLKQLWHEISRPNDWGSALEGQSAKMMEWLSFGQGICFGQPNFYTPRIPGPMVTMAPFLGHPGTPTATSYYDTSPMIATLERLAFQEKPKIRLSLGVTSVTEGTQKFFDSATETLRPEHVLASGSLPPGFPATVIDNHQYWDGGCVSNSPLDAILQNPPAGDAPAGDAIVFVIDLWRRENSQPKTMDDVLWRQKEIMYASRTTQNISSVAAKAHLQRQNVPNGGKKPGKLDIVRIVFNDKGNHIPNSDADFSRPSITLRMETGFRDMEMALNGMDWKELGLHDWVSSKSEHKVAVHEVTSGQLTSRIVDGM